MQAEPRLFEELLVNVEVQRLACGGAVLEARKIVLFDTVLQDVAVNGRRRTEGGHLVFLHLFEQLARNEHVHVVGEYGRTCYPLAINLAPECLGPTGFGNGQVAASVNYVLPVLGGHDVAERVAEGVGDHFRVAASATGKVHDHDVVVVRGSVSCGARKTRRADFVVVVEANPVLTGLSDGHERFDNVRVFAGGVDFLLECRIVVRDDHLDVGGLKAVFQVFGGEHVRCRNGNGTDAVERQQEEPEFVVTAQDQHHAVTLLDALFYEEVRSTLRGNRKVLEGKDVVFVVVIAPD